MHAHLFKATSLAALLVLGAAACRSAAPALSPVPPTDPGTGVIAAALPVPEPLPALAPAPQVPPEPAPPEPAPVAESATEEEPATEPERIQKEALEACQSAEELLGRGEVDAALAAVDRAYERMLELPANGDDTYLQAKEDIRILAADLIGRIHGAGRRAAAPTSTSWDLALPIVDNQHVQREIQSFTNGEREQFLEGYRRSGLYRPLILERLEKAGLPSQLSWLPLVESWFKVRALSRASALGLWQFISSTGVRYGLSRDTWVDERLDPEKSTDAAIAYLTDLHGLFGDWPKALAGYNCGEARVLRLSRPQEGEYLDFWDLYELLPRETRRYVPRLLAALQIIENPAKYGMTLPAPEAPPSGVATLRVERSVRLDRLDAALALEAGTLAALNPELRRQATPRRSYELRVPAGQEEVLRAQIASAPEWTPPAPTYATHRVRSGETLSQIAARYGTSVSALMHANGLRSANRLRVGQRLRVPEKAAQATR
ncbi:MAG TPA: transglycosylase SLT domain-containing protein [Vicinamibacteria bacterium]|nr:transglycosylase SLT domain-containing protein [Vicinamibacteria bacterium]